MPLGEKKIFAVSLTEAAKRATAYWGDYLALTL
jgi:hypothetical protein